MSGVILDKKVYGFAHWDTQKVIDLFGGSTSPGTQIITFHAHYDYQNNQLWRAQAVTDAKYSGYFYLINIQAGTALDLQPGSSGSPALLIGSQYAAGTTSQMWKFVSLTATGETPSWLIQNASQAVCVTVPNGTSQDSTQLQAAKQGDVPTAYQKYIAVPVTPAGWTAAPAS